ncbi:MAG TPA: hypothetical protein VLB09_08945, partial [Nitrospiria bacterium]|nr:hypothetical protein [Nitrospiria bacterium]
MDFFRFLSNIKPKNNTLTGTTLIVLCILTAACVARQVPVSERVRDSGLDKSGRPIAYQVLPKTSLGEVDWVASITEGILDPQSSL